MAERFRVRWSDSAVHDLDVIIDYIVKEDSVHAAHRIYNRIMRKIDSLCRFPRRGRIVPELSKIGLKTFREVQVFPYRILFRIYDKEVALVAILDSRRDLEEVLYERMTKI